MSISASTYPPVRVGALRVHVKMTSAYCKGRGEGGVRREVGGEREAVYGVRFKP